MDFDRDSEIESLRNTVTKTEQNAKVMEVLAKAGKVDSRMYTILVALYARMGNVSRANSLLKAMKLSRMLPTPHIYNLLVYYNGKDGNLDLSTQLFMEMKVFLSFFIAPTYSKFLATRNDSRL